MINNWKKYGILAASLLPASGAFANNFVDVTTPLTTASVEFQDADAVALVQQGKTALAQNKPAEAQQYFDQAIKKSKSKDARIFAMIGQAYVDADAKDMTYATKQLEAAVNLDPKNEAVLLTLGDIYLKQGDGGKALSSYDKAIAANSKSAKAYLKKGQLYGQARNFNSAKEALDAAVAADPNYAPTYLELAELYLRANQIPKSKEYIQKFVSMGENTPENQAKYASILYLSKDYNAALTEIQKVLQADPNNIAMNRLLAYTYFETKQNDKALEAMKAYFAKFDESKRIPSDYETYANILVEADKPQEAVEILEKAKTLDPKNPLYNDLLAKQYAKLKNYPKVVETYKAKFAVTPPTNTDLYYYGQALELNNDYKTADSVYAVITTNNPTYAYAYLWRGRVNANLDPESTQGLAKPHYEQFINIASADKEKYKKDLIVANSYLGYYYYLKKDKANAVKYWQEVKTLDPTNTQATEALKALR